MKNPWIYLQKKEKKYVLENDHPYIDCFNKENMRTSLEVHLDLLPEPFCGNPEAPVVLLQLNPGYKQEEVECQQNDKGLRIELLRNIQNPEEYPIHVHLFNKDGIAGRKWWRKVFRQIAKNDEIKYERIANNFLSVEYFPYHSEKFGHATLRLPSQEYSFFLVRKAIERKAYIICGRGRREWLGVVPRLSEHPKCCYLKNPQNISISENTINETNHFIEIRRLLLRDQIRNPSGNFNT